MPQKCAERGFRKSLDGLGLCHGPRITDADPGIRAVDGSNPALWDAWCGIGAVRHVQAHAALPAGSLPYQRSLREGDFVRRVEAAEDPFADLPDVGLFGVAAQGRDAAVADGGLRTRPPHSALEGLPAKDRWTGATFRGG